MKEKAPNLNIVEIIIILLNISIVDTLISSIIFGNLDWYYHQSIIVFFNILFLIVNSNKAKFYKQKSVKYYSIPLIIVFVLFIYETPRYILAEFEGRNIILSYLNAVAFITFLLILNSTFNKYKMKFGSVKAYFILVKPYIYFSFLISFAAIIVFFLGKMNLINLFDYPAPSGFSFYIDNNAEQGSEYYFPLYITIIDNSPRGANFFMDTALFSGLSHEPHIATYFMTPAFLLMFGVDDISKSIKIFFSIVFVLFFLIATSLTNFLSLVIIVLLFLSKRVIVNKKTLQIFILLIIISIVLFSTNSEKLGIDNVLLKLSSVGGSKDYSVNFIRYVLTPTTVIGDGVFNVPYPYAKVDNIGFISSMLIIVFYLSGFFISMKAIFQKNKLLSYTGLATFYFFLHSLKITQFVFVDTLTVFLLFVIIKAFKLKNTND